jgi:hypothetical protein
LGNGLWGKNEVCRKSISVFYYSGADMLLVHVDAAKLNSTSGILDKQINIISLFAGKAAGFRQMLTCFSEKLAVFGGC